MKEEQLQKIREKCIEANPEIMELKFGCRVEINADEYDTYFCTIIERDSWSNVKLQIPERDDLWMATDLIDKILGRPIRLADILRAIAENTGIHARSLVFNGEAIYFNSWGRDKLWNLREDNLTRQSEETIEFIYNLLK